MISENLRKEIGLKMDKLEGNTTYYNQRAKLVKQNLSHLGDIYSFWIENPELRHVCLRNKQADTIKKLARKGIQSIHNAWYFLKQQGKYGNLIEVLNPEILKGVNGLVNGGNKQSTDFRNHNVTLNISGFTPIGWEKVPREVDKVLSTVKERYAEDKIESAIYAHLALGLTQPFGEGNKRTARLIQDRILHVSGMPPAIITAGEGKFYLDLIKRTALAYREDDKKGQVQFYDYIASKVNNGLDEILDDLDIK